MKQILIYVNLFSIIHYFLLDAFLERKRTENRLSVPDEFYIQIPLSFKICRKDIFLDLDSIGDA